ncbi:MAG: nuclear transport factor 2 family protein [Cognatishimia sp.]
MCTTEAAIASLRIAEKARCEKLMNNDVDGLAQMLADNLVHVHLNGMMDDKTAYLACVRDRFRFLSVRRENLNIRIQGDVGVMIGELIQRTKTLATKEEFDIKAVTTQVWERKDGIWVLNTCHNALPA